MEPRTAIFSRLVRDVMRALPPRARPDDDLASIVRRMADEEASSLVVTAPGGRPVGIVTEQDITRRAAFSRPGDCPVSEIMTSPVMTIAAGEYLYHAIALMRRRGLRHMPVVDGDGALVGMLNLHDTLAVASRTLMEQIDGLTREDSVDGLTRVKAAEVDLADQLFRETLPAPEIQALLSHINLDIYRRVTDLTLAAMAADGLGPPPVEFSVIVMGSGGRGESFLFPDQDNGLILADYDDDRHAEVDPWFIEFSERLCRDLDRVGFPLCKGYVMATNPLWRKTISQWKRQIELWSRKRNTTTLRFCDIFFDFCSAWGRTDLALDLRHHVTETVRGNPAFLREMQEDDQDHGPALGWFGRFITVTENDAPGYKGYLNLKHSGSLPLVEAMRLLSLREGLTVSPTLDRISGLCMEGVLDTDEADYLAGAYRHITQLLLRQQIADFKAGRKVTNYVHPRSLTKREADILKDSFEAIRRLQDRMRSEFTGEVF